MKLKQFFTDDDAVSPVIGVILMVAITVILAAVIASFVLGLGESTGNNAPQASFSWDYDGQQLTVSHQGGDDIDPNELYLTGTATVGGSEVNVDLSWEDDLGVSSTVSAGTSVTLTDDASGLSGDVTSYDLDLVWEPSGGGESSVLDSDEGSA